MLSPKIAELRSVGRGKVVATHLTYPLPLSSAPSSPHGGVHAQDHNGVDGNISYREFLQFLGHEVRERTPPRSSCSPRRALSTARGGAASYGDRDGFSNADGARNVEDDYVRSPPRRRRQHTAHH